MDSRLTFRSLVWVLSAVLLTTSCGPGDFPEDPRSEELIALDYWTPTTGAWEVHGRIREKWAELGWERSTLGSPISDEYAVSAGRESEFQKGFPTFNAATGIVSVRMN